MKNSNDVAAELDAIRKAIAEQYERGVIDKTQLNKFFSLITDTQRLQSILRWL